MNIVQAIAAIERFQGNNLTGSIAVIESQIEGWGINEAKNFCHNEGIDDNFIESALSIKKVAGQINTIIHAAGILSSLQSILKPGERVEYVSLGAGNSGRRFDLETDYRVAEYKFIDWQGGPETIRQNALFKDFFELAEYETDKKKFLYVVDDKFPLKFFKSGRAIKSVLSRQPQILSRISKKYGAGFERVCDYYNIKHAEVSICDISPHIGRTK